MLGHLHIKNLAVLSEASVEFAPGWKFDPPARSKSALLTIVVKWQLTTIGPPAI